MSISDATLRQQLIDRCMELVSIPSVTGDEEQIAKRLEKWSRSVFKKKAISRIGNAVVAGIPQSERPTVALIGHTDTVPPHDGDPDPHVDGDHLVGLGSSDMKGSIAVMQALVENLDLDALPFEIALVLYDREEGPFADNGLQPLIDRMGWLHETDLAVVMEPTDGTMQLGCMGSMQATVAFVGQSAHSARPWEGKNAIHMGGAFLTRLHERPVRDVTIDGLLFRESMSATLCEGGRARNVIPDRFEVNVNFRFAPEGSPKEATDRALGELYAIAEDAEVTIKDIAPPGSIADENPLMDHFKAHMGTEVRPKIAWTDVARFAAIGVDAFNYGPGAGSQAHQAAEWISIDEMVKAYQNLHRALSTPLVME